MRVKSLVFAILFSVLPTAAHAQSYAIQGVERYFRVESSIGQGRRGPVVAGYVYNIYGHTADRIRLVVETLDGAGQVTSTTHAQVVGTVPPGDRGYFEVPVPRDGTSHRVRILSFDAVGRGP